MWYCCTAFTFLIPSPFRDRWNVNTSGFIIQLAIILAAAVCVPVIGFFIIRMRMVAGHFSIKWKRPLRLMPEELMGMRANAFHGYHPLYRYRVCDDEITNRIFQGGHVLVEGAPLSGKSRALFESLSRLPSRYRIAVLRPDSTDLQTFRLPLFFGLRNRRRMRIVVIDDFDRFIQKRNAPECLEVIDGEGCVIVAAGRRTHTLSDSALGDLYPLFGDPITIVPVVREKADVLVDTLVSTGAGASARLKQFNGAVGSICLPLKIMADRSDRLPPKERDVLTTILGLFQAGLYRGASEFSTEVVTLHMGRREPHRGLEDLSDQYECLENAGFLTTGRGMVTVETAYLEGGIPNDTPVIENIKQIAAAYSRDPLTLLSIAERLFSLAEESDDRVGYLLAARDMLVDALARVRSPGPSALRRMLYNNLGAVLGGLFEATGRFGYARQGITSFSRSLDEIQANFYRAEYADSLSNMASLYTLLAEKGGTGYHATVARDGFYESLTIYRDCVIPLKIAEAWANTGRALTISAVVERNPAHAARALEAFLEALGTYSPGTHPYGYARILSDLGRCYLALARFTNKEANARRAIEAFTRSLNIRTPGRFPREYAETRMEMAGALCVLAREVSFQEHTLKAIAVYRNVVDVYRKLNRPDRCAVVWELIGDNYLALARRMKDAPLASRSVAAYGEALKIWGEKSDPSRHAVLQYRIGGACRALFRYGSDLFALKRAARAFGVAVRIGEEHNQPASCGLAYQQLGKILLLLAGSNGGDSRTQYGHEAAFALTRALELFDEHRFSMNHRAAKKSLKEAYDIIGLSNSAMVDGKRLLLGYRDESNTKTRYFDPPGTSMQFRDRVEDDASRFEGSDPFDSPDIFKTGHDFRAAIRRLSTSR